MGAIKAEYIAAGGNRHPAASDWDITSGLLAFGSDRNIAIWGPQVRAHYHFSSSYNRVCYSHSHGIGRVGSICFRLHFLLLCVTFTGVICIVFRIGMTRSTFQPQYFDWNLFR